MAPTFEGLSRQPLQHRQVPAAGCTRARVLAHIIIYYLAYYTYQVSAVAGRRRRRGGRLTGRGSRAWPSRPRPRSRPVKVGA
jgi:hypothetical protein